VRPKNPPVIKPQTPEPPAPNQAQKIADPTYTTQEFVQALLSEPTAQHVGVTVATLLDADSEATKKINSSSIQVTRAQLLKSQRQKYQQAIRAIFDPALPSNDLLGSLTPVQRQQISALAMQTDHKSVALQLILNPPQPVAVKPGKNKAPLFDTKTICSRENIHSMRVKINCWIAKNDEKHRELLCVLLDPTHKSTLDLTEWFKTEEEIRNAKALVKCAILPLASLSSKRLPSEYEKVLLISLWRFLRNRPIADELLLPLSDYVDALIAKIQNSQSARPVNLTDDARLISFITALKLTDNKDAHAMGSDILKRFSILSLTSAQGIITSMFLFLFVVVIGKMLLESCRNTIHNLFKENG
jgi:hypothetical protein